MIIHKNLIASLIIIYLTIWNTNERASSKLAIAATLTAALIQNATAVEDREVKNRVRKKMKNLST